MNQNLMSGYRFATDAQWSACLITGAAPDAHPAIRPFTPFAGAPTRFATQGGFAPAISCVGEILWRGGGGSLYRLSDVDDKPQAVTAPYAIGHATRLVATTTTLWAAGDGSLQGFELDTLARQIVVETDGARVLDIAADGHDGLFALLAQRNGWRIAWFDCAGQLKGTTPLEEIADPTALVYLSRVDRLVVLAEKTSKLHWLTPGSSRPGLVMPVSAIRPCFDVTAIGSDARTRIFLGGTDGAPFGGLSHVLTLDAEGDRLSDFTIDEVPTGIAANRSELLVTGASGLQRFSAGASVPRDSSEVRAMILTPMLQSASTSAARRWLRAEANVRLPAGSSIELSFAATDDPGLREQAARILAEPGVATSRRLQALQTVLGPWRTISFHGDDSAASDTSAALAAPLFDIHARFLWAAITLIASPGGEIPVLSELQVLYPGETLMENLPAIYQRVESEPDSFLRSLVGVLETTTQTLDARISGLGRLIDPRTAPAAWLDYIARWLGLPWDDALSLEQKRNILAHASDIAAGRGTRAGLEALLSSLMPGDPPRFRIVDTAVEYGLSVVGGATCAGAALPTILGGLPSSAAELGMKATLGRARLPCADSENDPARLAARVRVDVMADANEQARWAPWLGTLIDDMVPITARAQLRWLSPAAFRRDMRLDDSLRLEGDPIAHLGTDAVTGLARLPERGVSLRRSGVASGISLH